MSRYWQLLLVAVILQWVVGCGGGTAASPQPAEPDSYRQAEGKPPSWADSAFRRTLGYIRSKGNFAEFTLESADREADGLTILHLQQMYGGMRIYNAYVITSQRPREQVEVVIDHTVHNLNGVSTTPTVSREQAINIARTAHGATQFLKIETRLSLMPSSIYTTDEPIIVTLVWQVSLFVQDPSPDYLDRIYLINAITGEIIAQNSLSIQ